MKSIFLTIRISGFGLIIAILIAFCLEEVVSNAAPSWRDRLVQRIALLTDLSLHANVGLKDILINAPLKS